MLLLLAALSLLVVSHVVPSHPRVRAWLISGVGQRLFYFGYSVASLLALVAVVAAYGAADPSPYVHVPTMTARYAAVVLMPFALLLIVCRLTQSPPRPHRPGDSRGIYRITSVPGSLGVLLWSVLHLMNVGALRTFLLFLAMALIAGLSLVKHAQTAGGPALLGAVPGARVVTGHESLRPREIGLWGPLLAVALFAALLFLHPLVIGPDPLLGVIS